MQLLLLSPLMFLLGIAGMFLSRAKGRWFYLLSLLFAEMYLFFDPRNITGDVTPLLRSIIPLLFGFIVGAVFTFRVDYYLILVFGFIASFMLAIVVGYSNTGVLSFGFIQLSILFLWYYSGFIAGLSTCGVAKPLFHRRWVSDPELNKNRRAVVRSLLINLFAFLLLGLIIVSPAGIGKIYWGFMVPLITPIMAVYGSYSWFGSSGQSEVFLGSLLASSDDRGRFFLGTIFLYLTLGTFLTVYLAIKHSSKKLFLYLAHFVLCLYHLPGLWLMRSISLILPLVLVFVISGCTGKSTSDSQPSAIPVKKDNCDFGTEVELSSEGYNKIFKEIELAGKTKSKESAERLACLSKNLDYLVRIRAVKAMADPEFVEQDICFQALSEAVNDLDWIVRSNAIKALGRVGQDRKEASQQVLLKRFEVEQNAKVKRFLQQAIESVAK